MADTPQAQQLRLRALRQMHRELICELYPDVPAVDLAALLACSVNAIYKQAATLGLSKNQVNTQPMCQERFSRYTGGIIRHLPGGVIQHLIRG
jgi:hypothetical protein